MQDRLLSITEVAELLGVSVATVRWWIHDGTAPDHFKVGRRIKFRTDCPLGTWCDTSGSDYQTVANNLLLVSLAQTFGIELDTYGSQPAPVTAVGPLPQL